MRNKLGKLNVTPAERRRAQRIANEHDHSNVLLRLHVGDDGQEIVHAEDVSKNGIGLRAYSPMRTGTPVQLAFNTGECDITQFGKITWCAKESDQTQSQEGGFFRLGVCFGDTETEADTLFYLAVKQRIIRDE